MTRKQLLSLGLGLWCCGLGCKGSDAIAGRNGGGMPGSSGNNGGGGNQGGIQGMGGGPGLGGTVGSVTPDGVPTKLPKVPELTNVLATPNDDSAHVTFDPVVGAKDYRIYELPSDDNIKIEADGSTTIKDAIYRCAGGRFAPPVPVDAEPLPQSGAFKSLVNSDVRGFKRTMADATLGYVYLTPGQGRVPVYAMGDPNKAADNLDCNFHRYSATRSKKYITSDQERTTMLADRWRDDGIAFYVPAPGTGGTKPVYSTVLEPNGQFAARIYFVDGPEKGARQGAQPVFDVLAAAGGDAVPLMRVFYSAVCGYSHDELAAGQARFDRVLRQGPIPATGVMWSPLKEEKILVVEALDKPCPYQGTLATTAFPAYDTYEPFFTLEQLKTTVFTGPGKGDTAPNATGEIFVNGQGDGNPRPRAIARSFVKLGPRAHEKMDWYADFKDGVPLAPLTPRSTGSAQQDYYASSPDYDLTFYEVDSNEVTKAIQWSMGPMLGALRVNYHDQAADTNGKFRLTPLVKGTMAANTFLHATMETDVLSSNRRYPQIFISDIDPPLQSNLTKGTTLLVQTFDAWPIQVQIQVCDHRYWDVNNQCPRFDLLKIGDKLAPVDEISEKSGLDWRVRFDVYASTKRVFVYVDGKPYGCADLPGNGLTAGQATVTFADVLYHSGADLEVPWMTFHRGGTANGLGHMLLTAQRNYDNLGFSSGVAPPPWDFGRFPCQNQTKM